MKAAKAKIDAILDKKRDEVEEIAEKLKKADKEKHGLEKLHKLI